MTFEEIFILLIVGSMPLAVVVTLGRHVLSAFRSIKSRKYKYAVFSALVILGLPLLSAVIMLVMIGSSWGAGESKSAVIFVYALMIYGASFGIWQLARHFDLKSDNQSDR